MTRYLYQDIANALDAYKRCTADSATAAHKLYAPEHLARVEKMNHMMPSGSGFDSGTSLDITASHAEKLVFTTSFHHMNEHGYYDGWTGHIVTVKPSFNGFNIRISGSNRNDIKELIHQSFESALNTEIDF